MKKFTVKNFELCYSATNDGGGTSIGLDFKNIFQTYYYNKKFKRCLEWCSGPGFIGFDLLLNDFCSELTLIDNHQPALDNVTNSLSAYNGDLSVRTFCLDTIASLPASEKFDLIVANPPHFSKPVYHQENIFKNETRIYLDQDWAIHRDFFQNISKNLAPDGIILLQESSWGCNYDSFDEFLVNIKRTNCYQTVQTVIDYPIFYIEYKLL